MLRRDESFLNLMGFRNVFLDPNTGYSSNPNLLNLTPEQQQQLMFMWQQSFQQNTPQFEQQTQTPPQTQSSQCQVDPEATSLRKHKLCG